MADDFHHNADSADFADDHEHVQTELFKAVLSKYPDETLQFLDGIAQRGDDEIASLLKKLRGESGSKSLDEPHGMSSDEVVPPMSDRAHAAEED